MDIARNSSTRGSGLNTGRLSEAGMGNFEVDLAFKNVSFVR